MRGCLGGCQLKWKTLEGKGTSNQPPVPSPQQLKKIFPSQVQFCHACPIVWCHVMVFLWVQGPPNSGGVFHPPPPGSVGVGCSPEQEERVGAGGGLHAPAGAARGAGARPHQK